MPFRRFVRIYWTFIWRFLVSYISLMMVANSFDVVLMDSVRAQTSQGWSFVWYYLMFVINVFLVCLCAAYGLWGVFQAKYRRFDIDVRTDKQADTF